MIRENAFPKALTNVSLQTGSKKTNKIEEIKTNCNTLNDAVPTTSQPKIGPTKKLKKNVDKKRVANKCLRIRQKQAEHTPISIPEGVDESKPKWRKYINFFRKKRSGDFNKNQSKLALLEDDKEKKATPKNKIGVLQRLRNLLKRKNKVAPLMVPSDTNIQVTEMISGKKTDDHGKNRLEVSNDNQSLDPVFLRSSLCSSTTSMSNTFEDDESKRNKTGINEVNAKNLKGSDNDDKFDAMWEKVTEMANNHKKLPPLKNVVIDVDITSLRKKSKKPSCVGNKKKERNPYNLEMKMIVAEHNRNNIINGRVTPLKLKHEQIGEMKLFKSCQSEGEKDDLRKKIALKNEQWKERMEKQKKEIREKNGRMKKMKNKLAHLREEKRKRDTKLPCYFEIPVNMTPHVDKPPLRPESVLSNNATKVSLAEHNRKVLANQFKLLAEKRQKLQSRNGHVRSVYEQMKMLPPRKYGDNECPDDGDNGNVASELVSGAEGFDFPTKH